MKLTDEQINALSDPEINVMMQICVSGADGYKPNSSMRTIYTRHDDSPSGLHVITVEDYCNDPSVMMPIAFENGISLVHEANAGVWIAAKATSIVVRGEIGTVNGVSIALPCNYMKAEFTLPHEHANPLRAAAIVYLKSKGVL